MLYRKVYKSHRLSTLKDLEEAILEKTIAKNSNAMLLPHIQVTVYTRAGKSKF